MTKTPVNPPVGEEMHQLQMLMRSARTAQLATLFRQNAALADMPDKDFAGYPYASLVQVGSSMEGMPVLLLSGLAEHTCNLAEDQRASLLYENIGGLASPLTGMRITLVGEIAPATEQDATRYLNRYPDARQYAGFKDFAFYRLIPRAAHLVAGFGKIDWIDAQAFLLQPEACTEIVAAEADIVTHMNSDHADAVARYASELLGQTAHGKWELCGCDPLGCDLRDEMTHIRLPFDTPAFTAMQVRKALVDHAQQAAKKAAPTGEK